MLAPIGLHFDVALRRLLVAAFTLVTILLDLPHWLVVLLHLLHRSFVRTGRGNKKWTGCYVSADHVCIAVAFNVSSC